MAFTDDDLKRLKEIAGKEEMEVDVSADACVFVMNSLPTILARLEAAELCARYLEAISENQRSPRENEALIAWLKSKGKGGEE